MTLYEDLEWRGLIKDVAGEDLEEKLNGEPITFYWEQIQLQIAYI